MVMVKIQTVMVLFLAGSQKERTIIWREARGAKLKDTAGKRKIWREARRYYDAKLKDTAGNVTRNGGKQKDMARNWKLKDTAGNVTRNGGKRNEKWREVLHHSRTSYVDNAPTSTPPTTDNKQ